MHELLFSHMRSYDLRRPTWGELAARAGIVDTVAFTTCLHDDGVLAEVRRDITDGARLGLRGTPLVLVDSLLFRGLPGIRFLSWYVQQHRAN
jgi:protein-disulfide isomerase